MNNNKYKYLFLIIIVVNVILAGLIVPQLINDKQVMLPAENNNSAGKTIDFKFTTVGINKDSYKTQFPYSLYLNSSNYQEVKTLQKDLVALDSLIQDKWIVREFILNVLTDSLNNRIFKVSAKANLDSLNSILQWAEKFKYYGEADPIYENQILFNSIHSYWLEKISKHLSEYSEKNENAKFNFQFRYLTAKCNEKRYNVSVKVSSVEKVIQNVLENKWAHLFEASWNQASLNQKILIFMLLFITLVSYVLTIKYLLKFKL